MIYLKSNVIWGSDRAHAYEQKHAAFFGTCMLKELSVFCYINHIWMPLHYSKRFCKNSEYALSKHPGTDTDTAHEGKTENALEKIDSYRNLCRIECCNLCCWKLVTIICRFSLYFQWISQKTNKKFSRYSWLSFENMTCSTQWYTQCCNCLLFLKHLCCSLYELYPYPYPHGYSVSTEVFLLNLFL